MQLLEFEKPIVELERELEKLRARSASQNIDVAVEVAAVEAKLAALGIPLPWPIAG